MVKGWVVVEKIKLSRYGGIEVLCNTRNFSIDYDYDYT
jgi:hypothetical protein